LFYFALKDTCNICHDTHVLSCMIQQDVTLNTR